MPGTAPDARPDQMLDDTLQADHMLFGPPQYMNAHGYRVPRDYYIHTGHGWARVEYGGRVRIGLDDFGNRLVGHVDKFRLPSLGNSVRNWPKSPSSLTGKGTRSV